MSLAKNILGKALFDLTQQDIEDYFIQPREETSILEFKSGEAKVNGIFKEICAFLNTEGGLLIVGTPKEQKVGKTGKRICRGKPVPSHFRSKQWLYSLLTANIVPVPDDIHIHEIPADGGKLYVIEVEQSHHPPHQFLTDGRYYIRSEQEARPASHGIVEALFFKYRYPRLLAELQIHRSPRNVENFNEIYIDITNTSAVPTDQVNYLIQLMNIQEINHNGEISAVKTGADGNYEIQGVIDRVLIDERNYPLHFEIVNRQEPFIVSVMVWNKDSRLFKINGLFDPMNFQFLDKHQTGDQSRKNLTELYNQLVAMKENLGWYPGRK